MWAFPPMKSGQVETGLTELVNTGLCHMSTVIHFSMLYMLAVLFLQILFNKHVQQEASNDNKQQ